MTIKRKRNILEMAVATACFGAAAVAAMPATAIAAPQSASAKSAHLKKVQKRVANANLLHEVVVNGFISSIQNSIAIQKNSNSIVEAISAQDIGRLPGTNIASALSQLPGVAVEMVGGRPQSVSVHGLGQDFNTALLNGVPLVTTAKDRGVHFNQYPPGWFKAIKVYISPKADLIGQGMGATFAMQTWRPLDERGPMGSLNVDYRWVSPGNLMPGPGVNDKGYGINGMYLNQFDHHKFGVAVGVDLDLYPSKRLREKPYGQTIDPAGDLVIGGSKNYNYSTLRKRQAYFATLQYRPFAGYTSTLDLFYENYRKTTQRKGMELQLADGANTTLSNVGPIVNGFVESGTFSNVYPVIRNDYDRHNDRVYDIDWDNQFKLTDSWTGSLRLSYNSAKRTYGKLENYSGFGYDGAANHATVAPTTVNFSYAPNGELLLSSPQNFAASSIVLTDPLGWGAGAGLVQQGFLNQQHNEEYLANLRADAKHYFESGPISSVEIGADYAHHHKNSALRQAFVVLPQTPGHDCLVFSATCTPTETAPIPAGAMTGAVDALGFMGIGPQVTYNPWALLASGVDVFYPTVASNTGPMGPPGWSLQENDTYGFVQFNIQTSLGPDVGLRGNFGVQVAHTTQESTGSRISAASTAGGSSKVILIPMTGGTSFTRYLPSLNLVFSFPHDYEARLGIARTMARPPVSDMAARLNIATNPAYLSSKNPNQSYFSSGGGNPKLLPTMATDVNVSVSKYFTGRAYRCTEAERRENSSLCLTGGTGYVTLSGFYYKLTDYINTLASTVYDFSAFEPSYLTPAEQQVLGTSEGLLTIPENNGAGHVYGVQLATNVPLGNLTPWLNGFGVLASATLTRSSVVYAGSTQPQALDGLSKWVENYTLYYGRDGFEAEVNMSSKTKALTRLYGISETRQYDVQAGQHWINAQVSYAFNSGMLRGLTLIASGENLGNEVKKVYQPNDPRQMVLWEQYGRTYHLGFSYNFY